MLPPTRVPYAVVGYCHTSHKHCIDSDTHHHKKSLKCKGAKSLKIIGSYRSHSGSLRLRRERVLLIHKDIFQSFAHKE